MILKQCVIVSFLAFTAFTPVGAQAHSGAKGIVKQRMEAMKSMRRDIKELRFVLESQGLDVTKAAHPANRIAAQAVEFPAMFPKGSHTPPSEVLPIAWDEWQEFEGKFTELSQSAKALAVAAEKADRQKAVQALQKVRDGCQACHDRYQVSK